MQRPARGLLPSLATAIVLVAGALLTAALAIGAARSHAGNERRLLELQTELTGSALQVVPSNFGRILVHAADVASASAAPGLSFRQQMAPSMSPKGPFASASLVEVRGDQLLLVARLGVSPLRDPADASALSLYRQALSRHSLITTRATTTHLQMLGYLLGETGPAGSFIVHASQRVPLPDVLSIKADSPDARLNVAIYFGHTTRASALVAATRPAPARTAGSATTVVPFGSTVLTLVASPKVPLAGALSAWLPFIVIGGGVALSLGLGGLTEWLVRRGRAAQLLALENGHLFAEQRELALTLQRSILPAVLPVVPGVAFAARYIPGARGVEVGGDWYSVIVGDGDDFYFVIGDVSGRGVRAAAVMAQLRYTLRAFALMGHAPNKILELAAQDLSLQTTGHFATVLIGRVQPDRRLQLASAGHFPPLLVHGDHAEYLPVDVGVPVGALARPSYQMSTHQLSPDARLFAFTDGLVERRRESLDDSLERLRAVVLAQQGPIEDQVTGIVETMVANGEDDTALLAMAFGEERTA